MNIKDKLAKFIRIISVPPIMITFLILILFYTRPDIFHNIFQMIIPIIFLGVFPSLAYLFQLLIPSLKIKGRESERKLAFIFSLIGYTLALIWAVFEKVSNELLHICLTYFLSVLVLTFINKVLKKRASGHACSVTGPLVFLIFLINWKFIFPCIAIAILIFWSSLYLKRHTKADLCGGVIANLFAFALSYLIIYL